MDYVALGRRIQLERRKIGYTQEKLAEIAKISASFVGHIERGSRKASLETIANIANGLKITIDPLMVDSLSYRTEDYLSGMLKLKPELKQVFNALIDDYIKNTAKEDADGFLSSPRTSLIS